MKHMAKKGKIAAKKCFFVLKVGNLGVRKYGLATNLERQNGAKCRFSSQKQTNRKT